MEELSAQLQTIRALDTSQSFATGTVDCVWILGSSP